MKRALILSILVKGLGAVLEILNQILITRFGSVELFGGYSYYVSITEVVCWLFISGIVKTNAYYISTGVNPRRFRRILYLAYAIAIMLGSFLLAAIGLPLISLALVAAFLYGMQMNLSSIHLACRQYKISLFGEYLVSRAVITFGILALIAFGQIDEVSLIALYATGFLASVCFFLLFKQTLCLPPEYTTGAMETSLVRKHITYQLTDVANGLVSQVPVIVQYILAGAFHAGVLSVVLIARKVMSFVAGPTAKVYLPEFAKRYAERDFTGLRAVYREIVLLQMCFVLPIALLMIGAAEPILLIYSPHLAGYGAWLQFASAVFLVMSFFGPQGTCLAMVGRERVEMISKWISLIAMVAAMWFAWPSEHFVLIGIAVQVVVDAATKQYFLVQALRGFPITLHDTAKLVVPSFILTLAVAIIPLTNTIRLGIAILAALVLMIILAFSFFPEEINRLTRRRV